MKIQNKIYTEYSFSKGLLSNTQITTSQKILITDHCNLHNFIINKKIFKERLIAACEIKISDFFLQKKVAGNITLIATNNKGYTEICELINAAHKNFKNHNKLSIKLKTLIQKHNIIILSGGYGGIYTKIINNTYLCIQLTKYLKKTNFNIEIQRFNKKAFQESLQLLQLGQLTHTLVYATAPIRYKTAAHFKQFRYKYCIQKKLYLEHGKTRTRKYKNNYFISNNKQNLLFKDCFKKLTSFKNITKHIKTQVNTTNTINNNNNHTHHFRQLKTKIIKNIKHNTHLQTHTYIKRINKELKIIKTTHFACYFLTTCKIVNWAKAHTIQVGPGRGSCASSLIAYILKITDIDPIKHSLIFERFLNKKKYTIPDFDIDFCKKDRQKVITYIKQHNTHKQVLNIITFNKFLEKNTIRDICRILGYNFKFSSKIISLIELQQLTHTHKKIKNLVKIAKSITGKIKAIGTHAGGIIINKNPMPISIIKTHTTQYLSQFDKYSIEQLKLPKIDILGLNTLTIIKEINNSTNAHINFRNINTTNTHIFELINTKNTTGIFQLEGKGITNYIKTHPVKTLEELTNIIAIYRPGPLNILKEQTTEILTTLPVIKHITKETHGTIIFQEQIIQIIKKLSHYSLNECDILRKKISQNTINTHSEQQHFINNCKTAYKNIATNIFLELKQISGYSFNKAHAVSYAYITYTTAFLKVYFKVDFFIALLNNNYKNSKKLIEITKNIQSNKIKLITIDIRISHYNTIKKHNTIITGLKTIKGLGKKLIKKIIKERQITPFKSIIDLINRFKKHTLNKKTIYTLYYSGALSKLENNKNKCFQQTLFAIKYRNKLHNYKSQQLTIKHSNIPNNKRNIIKELILEKTFSGCYNNLYSKLLAKIYKLISTKYLIAHHKQRIIIGILIWKFKTIKVYEYILETNTTNIKLKSKTNILANTKINTLIACLVQGMLLTKFIKLHG
ncbi:DNA polymerase III subunit alpha [Candidatus Vidania fulgoroideae]|uniref:DNA polymerase III subunit alpha n=1 Tax=Candidatus Vidania fulgoroideorum TaxID=881286 RepID=A0A974X7H8_9PROT|nr:DNA polymerase III subunit alpha [Candidatus Vidania fulgoroideae]